VKRECLRGFLIFFGDCLRHTFSFAFQSCLYLTGRDFVVLAIELDQIQQQQHKQSSTSIIVHRTVAINQTTAMFSVRNRSRARMGQHEDQHEVEEEDDDSDSSSAIRRSSSISNFFLDGVAAASATASPCRPSTPKEQPLFSSLRDVAIQQQFEDDEAGSGIVLRQMLQSWIFGIMIPLSAVAWKVTDRRWSATIGAAFFMPTFAIVQGAIGILTYRLYYGDAPIPLSPSHGVVVCTSGSSSSSAGSSDKNSSSLHKQHQQTRISSVGCECCGTFVPSHSFYSSALSKQSRLFLQRQQEQAVLYQQQQHSVNEESQEEASQQQQQTQRPLRLLVIGDSLAVGVGQKNSCTPVMPEVIAKTLSQKMGGRVVYWTCHGQTGASAAMLVRELERGQSAAAAAAAADLDTSIRSTLSMDENDLEITTSRILSSSTPLVPKTAAAARVAIVAPRSSSLSCCSDTDDSSSEEESSSEFNTGTSAGMRARTRSDNTSNRVIPRRRARTQRPRGGGGEMQHAHDFSKATFVTKTTTTPKEEEISATAVAASAASMTIWRDLLHEHRKLFEHPEYLGPYDIAVVLTGPNDLKGAVFPFLLNGEDKELQRQAKERGGSYRLELRRLLETLNRKMQWGNFQQFVSAAKESMREKMEETMERIIITTTSSSIATKTLTNTTANEIAAAPPRTNEVQNQDENVQCQRIDENEQQQQEQRNTGDKEHVPLIVLPGMPARALPLFQHVPLRWLAVPATDMMDMHKRHLAKSHPDQVLFVNAPTERELGSYVEELTTDLGDDDCSVAGYSCHDETVLLALRDVKRRACRQAKGAMRSYYAKKALGQKSTRTAYMNNPFKLIRTHLLGFPPASHLKAFSPDGVHPNDMGYEFWGRHIANAIYDKYMALEQETSSDCSTES
jgi:hypothetical protein